MWAPHLPTSSSSLSEARGRCFFQMSMVKSVELLLKMDVSEDIRAAIITAIMSPRRPAKMHTQTLRRMWKHLKSVVCLLGKRSIFSPLGMSSMTSLGKAMLEHPTSAPHTRTHSSGSTQPTESETWRRSQKLFACRSGRWSWLFLSSRSWFPLSPTKGTKGQIQGRSTWKHSNLSVPTTYNPYSQSHWSSQLVSTALPL